MPEKKYTITVTEVAEEKESGPPAKSAEKWFLIGLLAVGLLGSLGKAIGL